jgi:hypothetical protein
MDALRLSAGAMGKKELVSVMPIVEAALVLGSVALESIKVLPCVGVRDVGRERHRSLISSAFSFACTCVECVGGWARPQECMAVKQFEAQSCSWLTCSICHTADGMGQRGSMG